MRTKNLSARLLLSFVVVGSGLRVKGQSWTLTSAPVTNWTSIACSADGSKVVAASSGLIYTSTNAGKTWTTTTAPSGPWVSVASSADGVTLLAAENDHFENVAIYTSTNSGTEWIKGNASLDYYRGLTCSADGAKATVVASPRVPMADVGLIYTSTNSGIDWSGTSAPYEGWQAVASKRSVAMAGANQSWWWSSACPIYRHSCRRCCRDRVRRCVEYTLCILTCGNSAVGV